MRVKQGSSRIALLRHPTHMVPVIRKRMNTGFTPIRLEDYVALHLRANPDVERGDLIKRLKHTMEASKRGVRCQCGAPIWIIGSAEAGLSCFTCITGESAPDNDYEIDVSETANAA